MENGTVVIDRFRLRNGARPFVIAEVAQAHDGSLGFAHSFIDVVADAGADAVKFQTHLADQESTRDEQFRVPFSYEDASRFDYWRRMEFSYAQWQGLAEHAQSRNLIFLSSCFSAEAVRWMRQLNIKAWKVGSGEAFTPDLLDEMLKGGEPILLSTGLSSYQDISDAVQRIEKHGSQLALLQATTRYPTSYREIGLNVLDELVRRFELPVGLSDHSGTIWPSVAAMARGAALIEVHIAFHKSQFGPDTRASITPDELKALTDARDAITEMQENPIDKDMLARDERSTRQTFGKSLAPREALVAGTVLRADHLALKKPGNGLPHERLQEVVGRRLKHDVGADRLLRSDDLE